MGAWLSTHQMIYGTPRHRSIYSVTPTFIIFHNESSQYVRVHWIDYSGRKRVYSILKPGDVHAQSTFLTHAWTFDTLAHPSKYGEELPEQTKVGTLATDFRACANLVDLSTQQQIIYPSAGTVAKKVLIVDSPPVPWCIYSHLDFFREYKDTVKEVMLYYHRMLKLRGATQEAHLGCLPMALLMKILAEAAPEVYCEPRKPPQPDGTTPLDYTYKELLLLFEGASL